MVKPTTDAELAVSKKRNRLFDRDTFDLGKLREEDANKYVNGYLGVAWFIVVSSIAYSVFTGSGIDYLFDAIIMLVFMIGIYLRMRWAAIVFLAYFVIGHISVVFQYPRYGLGAGSVVMFVLLVAESYKGILGTIKLHRLKMEAPTELDSPHGKWFKILDTAYYPISWQGWAIYLLIIVSVVPLLADILRLNSGGMMDALASAPDDLTTASLWIGCLIALMQYRAQPIEELEIMPSKKLLFVKLLLAALTFFYVISVLVSTGISQPFTLLISFLPLLILYLARLRLREVILLGSVFFLYQMSIVVGLFLPLSNIQSPYLPPANMPGHGIFVAVYVCGLVLICVPFALSIWFLASPRSRELFREQSKTTPA